MAGPMSCSARVGSSNHLNSNSIGLGVFTSFYSPSLVAQMLIADFDGDGDQDLVTSKAAHAYGLAWFENVRDGDEVSFREHKITGDQPSESEFGLAFSQAHGLAVADMNRDGAPDFVTGKRWWAHSEHDPGSLEPAVLYWFRAERSAQGFRFVPELVDDDSGVGTQVTVGQLNRDDLPDILVGNKKGTFVFRQMVANDTEPSSAP